jgi:predicted Rossmann-fold nucleotide-binding protein
MQERKTEMAKLSSGFVVLPGGYGTWEEVYTLGLAHSSPTY